jgi:hypothetical protein
MAVTRAWLEAAVWLCRCWLDEVQGQRHSHGGAPMMVQWAELGRAFFHSGGRHLSTASLFPESLRRDGSRQVVSV